MQTIKKKLSYESYDLVTECDDICALCPNRINNVCKEEEKVKAYDLAVKQMIKEGLTPMPENICSDCQWYSICKDLSC